MSEGIVKVEMARVRVDKGTQMRVSIDHGVVHDYAQVIDQLPPVKVMEDAKGVLHLWDGFHTYRAHALKNRSLITCDITSGSLREAILAAMSANASHGLRRTVDDKKKAVGVMLADAEWSRLSDRDIAKHCAVSPAFVNGLRNGKAEKKEEPEPEKSVLDDTLPGFEPEQEEQDLPAQGDVKEDIKEESSLPGDGEATEQESAAEAAPSPEPDFITDELDNRCENEKVVLAFRQKKLMMKIAAAVLDIKKMAEDFWNTPASRNVSRQQFDAAIKQLRSIWKSAIPYAVCPLCKGDGCDTCGHGGFVTLDQYEGGIPEDLRWPIPV